MLIVAKDVTLNRLGSCDPELLPAVLWLLLATDVLGDVWEGSDAIAVVKYVEKCVCEHVNCHELVHIVAMVSCYYL